jgi:hypothetical protein
MRQVSGGWRTADGENPKSLLMSRCERVPSYAAGASMQQLSPALFFHHPLSATRHSQAPGR